MSFVLRRKEGRAAYFLNFKSFNSNISLPPKPFYIHFKLHPPTHYFSFHPFCPLSFINIFLPPCQFTSYSLVLCLTCLFYQALLNSTPFTFDHNLIITGHDQAFLLIQRTSSFFYRDKGAVDGNNCNGCDKDEGKKRKGM